MPQSLRQENRTVLFSYALFVLVLLSVFFGFSISTQAAINETINFQGKLVDQSDGTNFSGACATSCDFTFRIYDASTGGTELWSEVQTGVAVNDGIFNVRLGSVTTFASASLEFDSADLYLQVEVNADGAGGTYEEVFDNPRIQLTAVPFAFRAKYLDGVASDGFVQIVPGSAQDVTTAATSVIHINENDGGNTPNLIELEVAGSDVFVLGNGGSIDLNSSETTNDTFNIDASTNTTGDGLQISYNSTNLTSGFAFRVDDNGTDRFTIGDDGVLAWLGAAGVDAVFTTGAGTDLFNILTGNLKVGDGTPDIALDGEDAYIEGTLEVDGTVDFGSNVDFNNNELIEMRIENQAAAPTCDAAARGRLYHDTSNDLSYVCNGTTWNPIDDPATVVLGQFYDSTGNQNMNVAVGAPTALAWDSETRKDTGITHDNVTNNSRVQLDEAGWYKVSYSVSHENQSGNRKNVRCRVRLNGTTILGQSASYAYARDTADEWSTNSTTLIFQTTAANEYYEVICNGEGTEVGTVASNTVAGESWTVVEKIGGTTAASLLTVDFEDVYNEDADKTLTVSNALGFGVANTSTGNITFDLQTTGDFFIQDSLGALDLFTVLDTGAVGVGLANPSAQFHIAPAAANALQIDNFGTNTGETGEIRFVDIGGTNYIGFKAPDSIPLNTVWTLPNADGTTGQFLQTDGSGNLSWSDPENLVIAEFSDDVGPTQDMNTGTPTAVSWDTAEGVNTAGITATLPSTQITLDDAGWYIVTYQISSNYTGGGLFAHGDIHCFGQLNGATPIGASDSYSVVSNIGGASEVSNGASFVFETTSASEFYEIVCEGVGAGGTANTILGESWTRVEKVGLAGAVAPTGGTTDLDDAYTNDVDKVVSINGTNGTSSLEFLVTSNDDLRFDLQANGNFVVEDNNTPVFTVNSTGNVQLDQITDCNLLVTDGTGQVTCGTNQGAAFSAYDSSAGGQNVNAGAVVNIDQERFTSDATYYSLATDEVTIQQDGTYEISFSCTLDNTTANPRTDGRCYLELDSDGAGAGVFTEITGSQCFTYHRQPSQGDGSCSNTIIVNVDTSDGNDIIRLSAERNSGTGTLNTVGGASGLSINRLIAPGADLAEIYYTRDDSVEAGDVVSIDDNIYAGVEKTITAYDPSLMGVVSTDPAQVIGHEPGRETEGRPVLLGLAGRVPVKIDPDSEVIRPGDYLTSSGRPGMATKAVRSGTVIGKAMESWYPDEVNGVEPKKTIMVFIELSSIVIDEDQNSNGNLNNFIYEVEETDSDDSSDEESRLFNIGNVSNQINSIYSGNIYSNNIELTSSVITESFKINNSEFIEGDVVKLDNTANGLKKNTIRYENILGVVTSQNGIGLNARTEDSIKIATAGRVYVNVTDTNGEIIKGDSLVSSGTPGKLMKACGDSYCEGGNAIGYALENQNNQNQILIQISQHYHLGETNKLINISDESENLLNESDSTEILNQIFVGDNLALELDTPIKIDYLEVNKSTVFHGEIQIKSRVTFNGNNVGRAEIESGATEVEIQFEDQYKYKPVVTITIEGENDVKNYFVDEITTDGFLIKIDKQQPKDTLFNWHSFETDSPKIFKSKEVENSTPPPTPSPTQKPKTESGSELD